MSLGKILLNSTGSKMIKYLTHKLRTQSINDDNNTNEKVSYAETKCIRHLQICEILLYYKRIHVLQNIQYQFANKLYLLH